VAATLAQEDAYATSAQLHAAQIFRTAAGLHRLIFYPRAALRGAIPIFNTRLADRLRRFVDCGLGLSVEEARRASGHLSAADPELRVRRRIISPRFLPRHQRQSLPASEQKRGRALSPLHCTGRRSPLRSDSRR